MSLLVYAVGEREVELLGAHGLDARPLKAIEHDDLTMIVTEHEVAPVAVTEENLRRYEEVVEFLMEKQTVLPARFGTTFAEPEGSVAVLRERREEFKTGLDGVRDAVELGVQARSHSDEIARSAPLAQEQSRAGTSYLNSRLLLQRTSSQIEARLRPLRDLSWRSRVATLPRSGLAFAGAYLVRRPLVERFVLRAGELAEQLENADLEVTGPWPPYSFVKGEVA